MRTAPRVLAASALGVAVLVLVATDLLIRVRHPRTFPVGGALGWPVTSGLALATLAFTAVGLLLVARVRDNAYGWAPAGLGLGMGTLECSFAAEEVGALPRWLALSLASSALPVTFVAFVAVFALFPTGRLPSARWRWLGRVTVGAAVLQSAVLLVFGADDFGSHGGLLGPLDVGRGAAEAAGRVSEALIALESVLVMVAVAALGVRYRRAGATERQQLRWFAAAGLVLGSPLVVASVAGVLVPELDIGVLESGATAVSLLLVPVAIGVAVTRHRLYDLDRLVSRTVSYALLTGLLVTGYLGLVAGLRRPAGCPVPAGVGPSGPLVLLDLHEVTAVLRDTVTARSA